MARGSPGAFGGTAINNPWVWGAFCLVFLVGLADFRRPFSLRNLDLLFLLSPTASLWFFNHGDVFTAVPLFYPLLVWVVLRGIVDRPPEPRHAGRAALAGLGAARRDDLPRRLPDRAQRRALERDRRRLLGRDRRRADRQRGGAVGELPGREATKKSCGPADASGEIRDLVQTNGRCESANPEGDTYGPVAYESYIPGYLVLGWSGKWDDLPAAHFTSIAFDLLDDPRALARRAALRRAAARRRARVRVGGVPVHAVRLELEHERRAHAVPPRLGLLARLATGRARRLRGALRLDEVRVAHRRADVAHVSGTPSRSRSFVLGFVAATLAAFSVLLLEPHPLPRGPRLLDAHGRLPDRTRGAVVALGLAAVPRARAARTSTSFSVSCRSLLVVGAIAAAFFRAGSRRSSSPRSPRCCSPASSSS